MEFSRPEYWSGWPFPSPGDLSNPAIKPRSLVLQVDSLPDEPQGKPKIVEWVAYPFSRGSSRPGNRTRVSCTAGGFFTNWGKPSCYSKSFRVLFSHLGFNSPGIHFVCRVSIYSQPSSHGEPASCPDTTSGRSNFHCPTVPPLLHIKFSLGWVSYLCFPLCPIHLPDPHYRLK